MTKSSVPSISKDVFDLPHMTDRQTNKQTNKKQKQITLGFASNGVTGFKLYSSLKNSKYNKVFFEIFTEPVVKTRGRTSKKPA